MRWMLRQALAMILIAGQQAHAETACSKVTPKRDGAAFVTEIGEAWSGTMTQFAAAAAQPMKLLVSFYDADRYLTVASLDTTSGEVCRIRLSSRFEGWDGHNDIAMAVAPDGTVHVAGNAHASPLVYARGKSGNLSSFRIMPILGRDEDRATYPTFLRDADGNLLLLYRDGQSGDGRWLVNRWKSGSWERVGDAFASRDEQGPLSAYPSAFVRGPDGTLHVAVVWRRRMDVAANFAVGYGRSRDLKRWSGAKGPEAPAPVGPGQIDTVDRPGENQGLVNLAQLVLTDEGHPVIAYPRYGKEGKDSIVFARFDGANWRLKEVAHSQRRSNVAGGGVMTGLPRVTLTRERRNSASADIFFPPAERLRLLVDLSTLESRTNDRGPTSFGPRISPIVIPKGLVAPTKREVVVLENGFDGAPKARLVWFAQSSNRDRPHECTASAPLACKPPPAPVLVVTHAPQ